MARCCLLSSLWPPHVVGPDDFCSVPTSDTASGWVFYGLNALFNVFVLLPLGIREAVLQKYSDFRVFVASTAHLGGGLTYFESLQPSLLIFLIQGASVWVLHLWHLSLSEHWMLPLFLALLNPAIASIAIHIPFLGFRISIVPNSPTVSQP